MALKKYMRGWIGGALLLGGLSLSAAGPKAASGRGPLYVLTVTGAIDPVVKDYLKEGLARAGEASASAVLVKLDTPGGLLDATRDIVQDILAAPFPVIVYVSPRGARAASAGVFITLASDVAAMSPETHLGAAHPVSAGGSFELKGSSGSVLEEKAVSDTAAYARTLALAHGRNAEWAEEAVRKSVSLTAEEAVKKRVIDIVAGDEAELLSKLEGREVRKSGEVYRLSFKGTPLLRRDMSRSRRWLHVLANPNLAYILLALGFYALLYEFASPGVGLGGAVGVICLVLAFFSLQVLPLNYAGLSLFAVGLAMLAAEAFLPSHGILSVGGGLAFTVGSLFLFDRSEPYSRVSLPLVAGTGLGFLGFGLFLAKKALEIRGMKPRTGREGMVGETGEARAAGMVFVHGEIWMAEAAVPLAPGDRVRVLEVRGNRLVVEKI